ALTSPNAQGGGGFGDSVAIGGTTVVVGAPGETVSGHANAGHVYVWPTFEPVYVATFTETGLPPGTPWWVNITGELPLNSTTWAITTSLPNGSYTSAVTTANKLYSGMSTYTGSSFTVDGRVVAEAVHFSLDQFPVTFTETGLPA